MLREVKSAMQVDICIYVAILILARRNRLSFLKAPDLQARLKNPCLLVKDMGRRFSPSPPTP